MVDYSREKINVMQELIKTIEIFNKEIRESVVQINASIKNFSNNLLELNATGSENKKAVSSQNQRVKEENQENQENQKNKTFAETMEAIKLESASYSSNILKKAAAEYAIESKKLRAEIDKKKSDFAKSLKDSDPNAINAINDINKELDNLFKVKDEVLAKKRDEALANSASFKEAFATIHKSAEENFIKMIGGAQSFSETYKNIFDNMLTQIQAAFSKYMYQQLVKNPIDNLLNGIFGAVVGGSGGGSKDGGSSGGSAWEAMGGWKPLTIPGRASGGLANGWTVVGEEGPELVNFNNPARVYNNKETQAALSGMQKTQSPINITMNISTPDAGSFRQSKGQIAAGMGRVISAAARRNT